LCVPNILILIHTDTAMGVNMDALHNGESEYVKAVYLVKDAIAVRQRTPWYWPDFLYNYFTPMGWAVRRSINLMHQFAYKVTIHLCNIDAT